MKCILFALAIAIVSGCANNYQAPVTSTKSVYVFDAGVAGTQIQGLRVGMSPRRVLQEFNRRNWKYSTTSITTLEDMIERGLPDEHLYFSTNESNLSNLVVFFMNSRVFRINEKYNVSEQEFEGAVLKAKEHLSSLGKYSEKRDGVELLLEYKPSKSSNVSYKFFKYVPHQRDYSVSLTVLDLRH